MTAAQRRKAIEVARDVLLQLRLKRLTTDSGYLEVIQRHMPDADEDYNPLSENPNGSFQAVFKKDKSIVCSVCAIGAAYIGYINRFNRVKTCEVLAANDDDMIATMSNVFSQDQLRLMEGFFENGFVRQSPDWYDALDWEDTNKVDDIINAFYGRYHDSDQRLRAIMLNVIRNNGEFRIPLRMRR